MIPFLLETQLINSKLQESFQDIAFAFLKKRDIYFKDEKNLIIKLDVFQAETFIYVTFQLKNGKDVLESIRLADSYEKDKFDYITEIDLFLVRFYPLIDNCIKSRIFVHICPECGRVHTNSSMYFDRNYICGKCLGQNMEFGLSTDTKDKNDFVYFFESELTKLIKIGFSGNVPRRRKQIEAMQGGKINTLKVINSSQKNEKYLHEMFSHLKTHGEWFSPAPELISFIKDLKGFEDLADYAIIKEK